MPFCSIVIGLWLVVWGEEERGGGAEAEVGSRWEFLASCARGGMAGAHWLKAILHRQKLRFCCSR